MVTYIGCKVVLMACLWSSTAGAEPWKLVWFDEFGGTGLPDPNKWDYEEGFIRNNELQYYTRGRKENVHIEDGLLVIEGRKESWPNAMYDPNAPAGRGRRSRRSAEYTSASLTTKGKADWTYGKIEVRAKLPAGRGVWPAIWTLGANYDQVGWPRCGEIDIMESVGFEPNTAHATVHWAAGQPPRHVSKGSKIEIPELSKMFHTYSLEWDKDRLKFFLDGKPYFEFANEHTGEQAWPFDKPQYLILNLALGGSWGGQKGVDDSIFPQRFLIDYVRVYQKQP